MPRPFYAAQINAIAETLKSIFEEGAYADREISKTLKADKRRGSRDRAFIAERTYDVVRFYRRYAHLAGFEKPRTREDYWKMVGISLILDDVPLPDWKEFAGLDPSAIRATDQGLSENLPVFESIPDWLHETGREQLGERWEPTLRALNVQAPVVLRANRLKTTPKKLQGILTGEGIGTKLIEADALVVTERRNLFATAAFRQGLFEVQDFSSQQAAPALEADPGQTVVDACAGAGGKSLHLASLMDNRGQILSLDIHAWKLKELRKRATRGGIQNIETRPITSSKIIKRLRGRADRLLLDVPCSGLGVLRRNPDAKWKLSPDFVDRVAREQTDILARYSQMVKAGGKMVYATCSILPRENEEQVRRFLESEAGRPWQLEYERTYLPQTDGYDGFFVSRFVRE